MDLGLDDVVCPWCTTKMTIHLVDEPEAPDHGQPGWAECPQCRYYMNDGVFTVRDFVDGKADGEEFNSVNLGLWTRFVRRL